MDEARDSPQLSISDISSQCLDMFATAMHSAEPGPCLDVVSTQHRSFRVWVAYTGALSQPNASLDYRLKQHDHMKIAVMELLTLVKECLENEPCHVESTRLPENTDTQADREMKAAHRALKHTLESLHKLASAIRRASAPSSNFDLSARFSRVGGSYEPHFKDMARVLIRSRFPAAVNSLCDQLASAMAQRRGWLLYMKRHGEKLSQVQYRVTMPRSATEGAGNAKFRDEPDEAGLQRLSLLQRAHLYPMSETEASKPSSSVYNRIRRGQTSSIVSRSAGRYMRDDNYVYPDIPSFEKDDVYCQCPYCSEPLRTEDLTKSSWMRHVDKDIRPFVCLSENCNQPLHFFRHFSDWERHMVEKHSPNWPREVHSAIWYCDIKHQSVEFSRREEFESHLKNDH
ncbi:hypothetical protein GQ53DRAFT_809774, partial [Thozetella sp. PMI_491]